MAQSLAHSRWICKYHIVFSPKYRRKIIKILEGHMMADHIYLMLSTPLKYSVSQIMGYLKGKSAMMIFEKHATLIYKFGNRSFWAEGYYVSTVGLNTATIQKYIGEQEK